LCGISGKVYFNPHRSVEINDLKSMADVLYHRGPDGGGVHVQRNIGLAHRRLAIIDLREMANQPMCNEDGSIWVTFNGEIYNFQELRADLQQRGHQFRTSSDTEVILHAYEEYGQACVCHFRGMFAFAIWDGRTKTLFLARDRVGKKPLYYHVGSDRFLFGSEIKSILAEGSVVPRPDPISLDHYLTLQYIPAPQTAFQGILKLPAAHWLELRDGNVRIGRYWNLHYVPKRSISIGQALEEFTWHLQEAVRLRMISDVPLGAFLSGGMDSSAVVSAMTRMGVSGIRTFCAGFEQAEFDERLFAQNVATRLGTTHTDFLVQAPIKDILPRLVWHYDEPLGDSSAVPSYAVAELTRQYVTVVLNGDGGDESFAGYDRYLTDRRVRYGDIVPQGIRRGVYQFLKNFPPSWIQRQPLRKLVRVAQVLALDPERRYAEWGAHFHRADRETLYSESFLRQISTSDPEGLFVQSFAETDANNSTDAALNADVNLYLADDLLVKMDRATMAHSLEARSPFLDHVLMEFAASLPVDMKLAGHKKKYLLKTSLRGIVPDEVFLRPKMGFCVPLAQWFREDLREMTYDVLLSTRARQRNYFKSKGIENILREHCREGLDHGTHLWDLLIMELWHRTFIDGDTALHHGEIASVQEESTLVV